MKVQGMTGGMPVVGYNENTPRQNNFPEMPSSPVVDRNTQEDENVFNGNDLRQVEGAVQKLNKTMEVYNTELRFSIHEKSGEYYVKVVNPVDNTVIREIPPEKILDMVAYFKEQLGIVVDKFI